jgi:hypothetical protein
MEQPFCVTCGAAFHKNADGKGYSRYRLKTIITLQTCKVLFPSIKTRTGFCCRDCFKHIRTICHSRDNDGKYRIVSKTNKWKIGYEPPPIIPTTERINLNEIPDGISPARDVSDDITPIHSVSTSQTYPESSSTRKDNFKVINTIQPNIFFLYQL